MQYIKLQLGCLIVLLYISFVYIKECKRYKQRLSRRFFDELLLLGVVSVILDGMTAYTVNHLNEVNSILNMILHALFLTLLDSVIFVLCLYMLYITGAYPKKKIAKAGIFLPFILSVIIVVVNIGSLDYRVGSVTNYSMGLSAYTCFFMSAVYIVFTIVTFFRRWNYIEGHKRISILTYLLVLAFVTGIQMVFPETLITCVAVTICILGIYLNLEDPSIIKLSDYHSETVMAFANMIENRDNNTGGHIKRTSLYVQLIAEELRDEKKYREVLTKDYIDNLKKAAPMHDIGKISVPDAILQKPGKLTDEEYATMKLHAENGGRIIKETFENLGNEEYRQMAYEVARYHHEKWNGNGYPEGLKQEEIPLCARIMAVADVFDAVSEKRCYRDAMPLDKCFGIILNGRGQDFDPDVVDAFFSIRDTIERVHDELNQDNNQKINV